ncbi:MAG: hypothetical protein U0807_17465 [Candidatus Binatia bacterium]
MLIEAHVTKAVVDGEYGEITVTLRPTADVGPVALTVREAAIATTDGADAPPGLAFLPSDEGYVVAGIKADESCSRAFAVKPIGAEAGKTYTVEASATSGDTRLASTRLAIFVEARPEVYAALGAVEHLRRTLLGAYEALKQVGRDVHREHGTVLPNTRVEAPQKTLEPESLQWALDMVEQGTRYFRDRVPQPKR